jgi:hypothetical protein
MITKASVAALAALLVVPGFVRAGQQPTATEIYELRAHCAAIRREVEKGYADEMEKQEPIPDAVVNGRYTSNYNIVTSRCYIFFESTLEIFHRNPKDGKLLLDEPPSKHISWYLSDYQTSKEPIAYCVSGPDADDYSFTPAGHVTAKEACAFIDKMMHDDLDKRQ